MASVVEHLRQTMEQEITGMSRDVNRLLHDTEANYSEYYVRTVTQETASLLREIEMLARHIDEQLREKVSGLKYATNHYADTDRQAEKLSQSQISTSHFDQRSPFAPLQDLTGNRLFSPTNSSSPDSIAFSNLFEQLQAIQRQGLLVRLSPVKEDPRIASLLQTMQNGDSMAQRLAQLELEKIAEAFTEIARSQKAYVVYQAYGHREYMESAHQYAEAQRKKLEEMGVSGEWYKEGIDLSDFYQGGLLEACRYNPLKNDRSLLLDDEEIRALLEQGMLGEVELDVLRQRYDELEVKVLQRQQLEQQLEEYNQLVAEEDIRKMQQLLKDMNLYHGEVTGEYNQELLIAVAGYQYIANNHSTLFAVWRELSGYHEGKEFEVDGLITKELIEVADAERELGYWNDPGVKASGVGVAMTTVGVGDGIVSQVWDEGSGLVKQVWSVNPTNPKFWTETMPGYYDLAKAIANGDITLEDIKEALKEGAAEEFVVPFQDIYDLQEKILSGKASYEESQRYGRALVKAFLALTLVEGAVKSGVKISGRLSRQLSELLPKLNGGAVVVAEGGMKVKVPDTYRIETPESPDIQRKQYEVDRKRGEEGTKGTGNLIFKSDYDDHLINVKKFDRDPSKGITGGHNMGEFYNYFRNVLKLDDVDFINKVTPHPTIDGIIQINYKIPKLDNKGNLTGEYKYFKNPKTVYDSSKISEATIIEWGKAAMQQGIDSGSIVGRKITGIAPNGLKFEGYMDANGIITKFYPKLD
ncbi:CdiA family toxin C-terminal domain-containing protein [Paenibacillus aceti]|nr:CdiA family toxin C-terminal domain-containing protein [Paenibacillus aceti]